MKVKEVQAGVKITQDYDSYQISLTADLEAGESPEKIGKELIKRASNIVEDEIENNKGKKKSGPVKPKKSGKPGKGKPGRREEVGAAWFDKKLNNVLNIQYSKTREWENIKLKDLEKIDENTYKQKTDEGVFIFKKIPEEKRKNKKMPVYRIYNVSENSDNSPDKINQEEKNE